MPKNKERDVVVYEYEINTRSHIGLWNHLSEGYIITSATPIGSKYIVYTLILNDSPAN